MTRTGWSGSSSRTSSGAGLTDAQPLAYLEALPGETSCALVFIVPHQRKYGLWGELREKCRRNGVELESESTADNITWARTGHRTLAITSWKHVLGTLEQAAGAEGHSALQQDIVQLRGLTDQMNAGEFLPLREDEVTDVNVARRLTNYSGLIEEIVGRLVTDGIADTKGLLPSHGYYAAGRFLRVHAKFGLWLGVRLDAWRDWGVTPIWWRQHTKFPFSGVEGKLHQAAALFNEAQEKDGVLYIPIHLTTRGRTRSSDRGRGSTDAQYRRQAAGSVSGRIAHRPQPCSGVGEEIEKGRGRHRSVKLRPAPRSSRRHWRT